MLQTLLQKRSNGYYYFRWVCPPVIRKLLGKREIIKSLRTTSKIQALARAGVYYMAVDKLKALYDSLMSDQSAWAEACKARDKFLDEQEGAIAYASAYAHAKATTKVDAEAYAEAY